ncbi:amidase family protein [Pseudoclavibacter sp. 13-3]|uniref:amidase family protein n=1 Tax=Pseudoclavibacter sp. 13-3 TaxID=2901228 RepID=UPI001E5A829C|nr:amidase family protein [Pseudoclavibacter sp. 13-3]MCD7101317.1 amidase [Pseudoclavibacter sp. 13-3]
MENPREVDVVEASVATLRGWLECGAVTSTELVVQYLNRIFRYDLGGIRLNAVPLVARDAFLEAARLDRLRAEGRLLGPLHGIPFTVKDSYLVRGMSMAAGSPALVATESHEDSATVARLRAAGALVIGRTNMPPMAAGGVQRGVYGRAESPYSRDWLSAAWDSGSSNGSGVSTAASFAAFGMAEETVSSGRSPASNNGLAAYTPSRGVLSLRGNWPLHATKDVVVPHARTVADLCEVIDVLAVPDDDTRGDFWRQQQAVELATVDLSERQGLVGLRIGVLSPYAGLTSGEIPAVHVRPSIRRLFDEALETLRAHGAQVIWVDFPLRDRYESAPRTLASFVRDGVLPAEWMSTEWGVLNPLVTQQFMRDFNFTGPHSLVNIDSETIFPTRPDSVDRKSGRQYGFYREVIPRLAEQSVHELADVPGLAAGVQGLEQIRRIWLEKWMQDQGLDVVVFPANSDIGAANTDVSVVEDVVARQDGTGFSNGNRMIRHLGIPTVSVCMGIMPDTDMPVDITFAGVSGADGTLLQVAAEYERSSQRRCAPRRTPQLPALPRLVGAGAVGGLPISVTAQLSQNEQALSYEIVSDQPVDRARVFVNGDLKVELGAQETTGTVSVADHLDERVLGIVVVAAAGDAIGAAATICDRQRARGRGAL